MNSLKSLKSLESLKKIVLLAMFVLAFGVLGAFAQEKSERTSKDDKTAATSAEDTAPVAVAAPEGPGVLVDSAAQNENWLSNSMLKNLNFKPDAPDAVNNYVPTRATAITYNSISTTGTSPTAFRNGTNTDDNLTENLPIGFTFIYNGQAVQQFRMSTSGFLTFNTTSAATGSGTGAYGYQNTQFSAVGGTTNTLAPFYEDQQTAANLGTLADLQASLKYQTTGTAGSRVLTAEWINFQDFSTTSTASFNYQVKIYEADGHIEFVYGTMNATGTTTTFSYTVGINAATISATPTAAELLTQQTANTNVFSSTPQNALAIVPESNSMLTFTPPAIVPAAPTNLTFTNIRPGSVQLNWVDNATNETNYNILISTDGINFQTFGAVLAANTTGVTINGLLPNTTYFFRVIATTEGFASTPLDGSVTTAPPISGTKTIGPGGDFTTFAAAITDLNGGTGAGGVIFNVAAGTVFPENGTCITVQGTAASPIIFQKSGTGANPIIQPPGSASTVDSGVCILGGDFITFDGIDIVVATGNTAVERGFDIENLTGTNGANNNTIKNTSITMNRANTSSLGIFQGDFTPTSAAGTNSNNKYQNLKIQNSAQGILFQGSTAFQDTGNEISTTTPNTFNQIGSPTTLNDIGNFATATIYGIQVTNQNGVTIRNNEIQNVTSTSTSSSVYGIYMNNTGSNTFSVGTNNVNNNKIHDIQLTGTATTGVVYGIREELTANAASVSQVYNNFIYNLNTTSTATTTRKVIGIGAQIGGTGGGSTHNIDFNSVRIALTSLVTSSTAFETGTSTPVFRIRDNIFSNFTGAQTTGSHYAVVFTSSAIGAAGSVSNYNDLYVANTTGGFVGNTSGTNRTDLAAFRTATGQDANSISADPLFVSATDLHVSPTSPVVDAGTTIPYTNKDIDGQNRVGNPDIGADEPGGTTPPANDIAATAIINPPSGSIFGVGATVTPTASFTNVGNATQTNVSVSFTIAGPGGYFYTNTKTIASIAVDQTVTVTFDPTPAFTTAGIYNMTAAVATADANSANDTQSGSFQVIAPLAGSVNVGTGEAFTSLTNPGGVFANLNGAGATGNVVINITSDLTAETGTVALNELAGGFTVTIKPSGAARIVSGSAATSLIRLNGADNVTIDGSLTGGTDKSLTISNTNTSGAVIHFLNAATADTVKNSILQGVSTSTLNGVVFFSTVSTGTVGNSNDTIQNNDIRGGATATSNGIYNSGTSTAKNTNNVITQNRIFDFSAFGINDAGSSVNALYSRNEIFELTPQTTILVGFSPRSTSIDGFTFTQNYIHDLNSTSQITGISLFDTSTLQTSLMSNNMIALSVDTATLVRGIYHNTATGEKYNVYHNSIYIGGTTTGTNTSEAYYRAVADTTNLRNNIFVNARTTTGTGKQYAIRTVTATSVFTSDFNDIFNTGGATSTTNIFGQVGTTDTADLAAFRTASGTDANSKSVDPLFVSTNNLHLQPTSPVINMGTPLASVPLDFDGQTRDAAPDIGADEILPGTLAFATATTSVNENAAIGVVTITVNRTGGSDGAVTVPFTLADGTATGGAACGGAVDFVNTGGTISFAAGQTTQTFNVAICDDAIFEGNETFTVVLGTATGGATTGTPSTITVTILDNETAPMFAINDVTLNEGDAGTTSFVFTVTRGGALGTAASVDFATADGTATAPSDYTATGGTLNFAIGSATQQITVLVNGDTAIEPTEAFTVNLTNALGAAIIDAQGVGTITNDDFDTTAPTVVITQAAGQTDPTTAATVNFTVTFSEPVTGFGAEAGDVIVTGSAFGAGSTPTVTVTGSGTTYNVAVTGYNQSGTVIINIPAGAAQDPSNNQSTASNPAVGDNTVTVSFGTTLFVDDDGRAGSGGCDTNDTAFTLIQSAIDAAATGNTIQVCPGVYNERIVVNKSLTINGAQANNLAKPRVAPAAESTIVVDNSTTTPVDIEADNVTFNGFAFDINQTFPSTTTTDKPTYIILGNTVTGFGADGYNNIRILNNRLAAAAGYETVNADRRAIGFATPVDSTIEGNFIANYPSQSVTISDGSTNLIYRNNDSFNAAGSSITLQSNFRRDPPLRRHVNYLIENNRFDQDGALLFLSQGGIIRGNTFTQAVEEAGILMLGGNDSVSITGNTFTLMNRQAMLSSDGGFGFGQDSNISFTGNTVTRAADATTTGSSSAIDYRGTGGTNTISNNTVRISGTLPAGNSTFGIRLRGSASGNFTIANNLFDGGGITAAGTTPLATGLNIISNAAANGTPVGNTGVFPAASVVNVNCNTFTRFQDGISVFDTVNNTFGNLQSAANITINNNNIDRNSNFGINNAGTSATLNAENNYWGAANGPGPVGPGSGDRVTANVDFDPFLTAPPACAPMLLTSLTINDVTQPEGNAGTSNFVFTVTRTGDTTAATTVNFTTVDGTATAASGDYVAASGTLTFAAGQLTQTITVVVNGDTIIEPTETFTVRLSGATNGTVTDADGLGTITNDDFDTTPPTVVVTQAAGQADPTTATTVNFTVTFSEPVTGFGAQAGDVIVSGTAFGAGSTKTVTVTGSGTTYNVAVTGYNQNGTVIITIPAGAAQDPANNNNLASNPAQGDNTITVFPGATTLYVDDDGLAGPGGCDTAVAGISNIQSAVNASASGGMIQVCPGTYTQNVTVDKPLTILGPNANIDPNTGTRVPEAILLTTVSNPVNNNCDFNTDSNIITLTAANAVVRGFTFDGDNPALNSTFNFNGANIDAYSAVFQQNVNNPNADVSNNIVKNTSEFGIILGSNDNASPRTNSTIARNRLDNIVGFCFGEAIRIGENAYANVTDNVVTRSFNGVTIENFNNSPTTRPASLINNNRVQAYGFAIYHNLHYNYTGNGFTISNNTINSYVQQLPPAFARSNNDKALGAGEQPSGGGSAFDKFRGVMLESIIGQVPVTVSNNRILPDRNALIAANYTRVDGIFITNTSTDSPNIAITSNQISNSFRGISHVAPAVPTLTCNAISGNDVGLYVGTDTQFGGTPSSSTNGINVTMNNFTFNTAFGLQNDSSFMVIAENNYWNSPSGPRSPANPNGTGDRVSPNVDFTPFATAPTCGPTASGATLSGRVSTSTGQGIAKVKLTLTDSQGVARTMTSGRGGNFTFTDVTVGETYVLSISSRGFQFAEPTRVITVSENISGIDFIAY